MATFGSPHVGGWRLAVDVQEPHRVAKALDAVLGELAAELGRVPQRGHARELARQGLHLGARSRPSRRPSSGGTGRRMLLERLGPLDAQEREEQDLRSNRSW